MSAQLTLADGEMEVLRKAVSELEAISQTDEEALSGAERVALRRADEKLRRGLSRPGVRYPKMRR